jgi:hypothetical protein
MRSLHVFSEIINVTRESDHDSGYYTSMESLRVHTTKPSPRASHGK